MPRNNSKWILFNTTKKQKLTTYTMNERALGDLQSFSETHINYKISAFFAFVFVLYCFTFSCLTLILLVSTKISLSMYLRRNAFFLGIFLRHISMVTHSWLLQWKHPKWPSVKLKKNFKMIILAKKTTSTFHGSKRPMTINEKQF